MQRLWGKFLLVVTVLSLFVGPASGATYTPASDCTASADFSASKWNNCVADLAAAINSRPEIGVPFKEYTKGNLPPPGTPGRIVRVTDDVRGLWMDQGALWFALSGRIFNVQEFGAKGDGTSDDTSAITSAISAAGPDSVIYLPSGTYKTTDTLIISNHRVHLVGAGMHATRIKFMPTAAGAAIRVRGGATELFQGSIRNIAFTSDDLTYEKTAIELVDTSGWLVEDIASYPWAGGNSIGIRSRGREFGMFRNLYISADRPIVISDNPNHSIDIDHHHFQDLYLTASGNPVVEIDSGVNLTHVTFDGAQAWVKGTAGLKWVDTATKRVGIALSLNNVRWEQPESSSGYAVRIEHNTNLYQFSMGNSYLGPDANGMKLRRVRSAHLDTVAYVSIRGEALNVDGTVYPLHLTNCLWQTGSTASVSGLRTLWAAPRTPVAGPLPGTAMYDASTNGDLTVQSQAAHMGVSITIANGQTAVIGPNTLQGFLHVIDDGGGGAIYYLKGTHNITRKIADPEGMYSPAQGSASSINIYASGGHYVIENKRGVTKKVRWYLLAAHAF